MKGCLGTAAALVLTATPAMAFDGLGSSTPVEQSDLQEFRRPNPLLAATLSAFAFPAAATTLGILAHGSSSPAARNASLVALGFTPLMSGLGQLYAGDERRAMWVGLGTYACIAGTALLVLPTTAATSNSGAVGLDWGACWPLLAYSLLAGGDAFLVAYPKYVDHPPERPVSSVDRSNSHRSEQWQK